MYGRSRAPAPLGPAGSTPTAVEDHHLARGLRHACRRRRRAPGRCQLLRCVWACTQRSSESRGAVVPERARVRRDNPPAREAPEIRTRAAAASLRAALRRAHGRWGRCGGVLRPQRGFESLKPRGGESVVCSSSGGRRAARAPARADGQSARAAGQSPGLQLEPPVAALGGVGARASAPARSPRAIAAVGRRKRPKTAESAFTPRPDSGRLLGGGTTARRSACLGASEPSGPAGTDSASIRQPKATPTPMRGASPGPGPDSESGPAGPPLQDSAPSLSRKPCSATPGRPQGTPRPPGPGEILSQAPLSKRGRATHRPSEAST